jgi:hypothetical protein
MYNVIFTEGTMIAYDDSEDGKIYTEETIIDSLLFDTFENLSNFNLKFILDFSIYKPSYLKDINHTVSNIKETFDFEDNRKFYDTDITNTDVYLRDVLKEVGEHTKEDFDLSRENPKFIKDEKLLENGKYEVCIAEHVIAKILESHGRYSNYSIRFYTDVKAYILKTPIFTNNEEEIIEYKLIKNLEG